MISTEPNRNNRLRFIIGGWFVLALILSWPGYGITLMDDETTEGARDKKLHITADKLVSDGNANYIVFTGSVIAVYDDTTINADRLEVFYESTAAGAGRMAEENIKKIIATGHVTIGFGERTAECDRAVYTAKNRTIVMTGANTRIQSGSDYISGEKITIDQTKGHIMVDGSPDQRVNAVFMPQNNETTESGSIEDHDDTGAE